MVSPKQLHRLATNPMAHMRFQATGQLPRTVTPESPLIDLLDAINPRDRAGIVGLTINQSLGYQSSRQFHNGEQALRWVRPSREMLDSESWPAESCRLKHFRGPIFLEQLLENASSFPEGIKARHPRLCDPALRAQRLAQPIEPVAGPDTEQKDQPERPRG